MARPYWLVVVALVAATVSFAYGCKRQAASAVLADEAQASTLVASGKTCDFYDTFEQVKQCGSSGYPLGYGKKYCTRFGELCGGHLKSEKSRAWVDATMNCLQRRLIDAHQRDAGASCPQVKTQAFADHPGCYLGQFYNDEYGKLPSICLLPVREVPFIGTCVDVRDLATKDSAIQVAAVMARCAEIYKDKAVEKAGKLKDGASRLAKAGVVKTAEAGRVAIDKSKAAGGVAVTKVSKTFGSLKRKILRKRGGNLTDGAAPIALIRDEYEESLLTFDAADLERLADDADSEVDAYIDEQMLQGGSALRELSDEDRFQSAVDVADVFERAAAAALDSVDDFGEEAFDPDFGDAADVPSSGEEQP